LLNPQNWAILLITYGAGNVPMSPWFISAIEKAISQKKVIVNITQCVKGKVNMSMYKNGRVLLDLGVVSGSDITSEAALAKLMYLKSKKISTAETKIQFESSLRGEMTE
jgi:L-asparaginase